MTLDAFLSATPKVWKESNRFPDAELYAKSFEKIHLKKSNIQKTRQTLKIIGVAISNHIIYFWFLSIFGHFRITQEKPKSVDSKQEN